MSAPNQQPPNTTDTIQEPPKKKQKKSRQSYWLVKVPTWVAEEWFNDKKYPHGARLADLYILPNASKDGKKNMKLEITRPPTSMMMRSHHSNHSMHSLSSNNSHNNPLKQFEDLPIPSQLKITERDKRKRVNVKHGELVAVGGKDELLVFQDKPAFPVGSKVEALNNSYDNRSSFGSDQEDEDEDVDINMKDKGNTKGNNKKKKEKDTMVALKGYSKGVIKHINDDRTFTVEFNKGKKLRYNVPERDIRFIDPNEAHKANRCKIYHKGVSEMDVTPQWTPQYKEFLQLRAMKKSMANTMQIKKKTDVYALSKKERDRIAELRVKANKRGEKGGNKNRNGREERKPKRVKNVRKEDKQYENLIFAAFEKDSVLTQKEIEQRCHGEPWNFLRPIVQQICDRHANAGKSGRSWVLKPEYRLATDQVIETNNNSLLNDE